MTSNQSPLRVILLGAGRVGTAVAELLRRHGHEIVAVVSRSEDSARRAADMLGSDVRAADKAVYDEVDLILIGTSDDSIGWAAEQIATSITPGSIACHFSGAHGVAPLLPIAKAGGEVCALHPVQAFPDVATALERLPGSAWGITCSPGLQEWASDFVTSQLEGTPVTVAEESRPLWHAASVVTANGIAALLAAGESILATIGVDRPESVLGPLASGAVANARIGGGAATLTGPVVRGEASTITRHMDALAGNAPELLSPYVLATRLILETARQSGRLKESSVTEMASLLASV